jgi:hypothetical protein
MAGILSAVGAGSSGFLGRVAQRGAIEYAWGDTLRYAAVFALIGGVLSLGRQEIGVPIVVGSSVAIAAVVGTIVAGLHMHLEPITDRYPVRGAMFVGAGVVAILGVVAGLAALRGDAHNGFAVPVALFAVVSLFCTAASLHLDENRAAPQVRPFVGYAAIALVVIIASFAGRYGVLAGGVAAGAIVWQFVDSIEFNDFRPAAMVINVATCALLIVVSAAAMVVASRQRLRLSPDAWLFDSSVHTTEFATSGATAVVPATGGAVRAATAPDDFAARADHLLSGHPIMKGFESTTAMPVQRSIEHETATGIVSVVGQWAEDPYHRHQMRYWDGARWTEHVEDDGRASLDPV